jgi:hypothetical protein
VQTGGQQLLGVEGVALRPRHDALDERRRRRTGRAGEPSHERRHVRVAQRGELDPLHARQAHQLGEQRPQRVTAVQIVGTVGGHHHHRLVDQPGQEVAEQVAAGPVGPVHVLQHDQQRGDRCQLADESGHRLEQLEAAVVDLLRRSAVRQRPAQVPPLGGRQHRRERRRPPGQQCGQDGVSHGGGGQLRLDRDRPEQVDEGQVGQPDVTEIDAVPRQHPHAALGRAGGELVEQPGLAHPGVTGQQDRGAASCDRPLEVRQQAGELVGPSHHRRVVPAWHGVDRGTGLQQHGAGSGAGQLGRRRLRNQAPRRVRVPRPAAISISRR